MPKWMNVLENSKLTPQVKKEIKKAVLYHLDINDNDKIIKAYLYIKKDLLTLDNNISKHFTTSGKWTLIIIITNNKTEAVL